MRNMVLLIPLLTNLVLLTYHFKCFLKRKCVTDKLKDQPTDIAEYRVVCKRQVNDMAFLPEEISEDARSAKTFCPSRSTSASARALHVFAYEKIVFSEHVSKEKGTQLSIPYYKLESEGVVALTNSGSLATSSST